MPIDIANMIVNIKAAQNLDWGNFWAAGFGALSAYWFNRKSEDIKEKTKNICSLRCLIQVLTSQFGILTELKTNIINQDFINRKNAESIKEKGPIFYVENFVDFDISRIDFIVTQNPHFYHSISGYFNHLISLKKIITEYNGHVKEYSQCKNTDDKDTISEIIHRRNLLIKAAALELDYCILLNYQTISNCAVYSIDYFGFKNAIMPAFTDEHIKIINSINPIKLYEVKKRTFIEKYFPSVYFQYQTVKNKHKKGGE